MPYAKISNSTHLMKQGPNPLRTWRKTFLQTSVLEGLTGYGKMSRFISWEDQGYSLLGEEAWCAKVRMCLWGRVSGPGYDGSSLCCLIIDSWCDDLSVTPTMFPACFSWREGWTAIPTKAFTQVLLVWRHLQAFSCGVTYNALPGPLEGGSPASLL